MFLPEGRMRLATTYQAVLGRLIVRKRQERQMDQGTLARHIGVDRSTWSRIETGSSPMKIDQLAKAAEKVSLSVGELTTEADNVVRELRKQNVRVYSSLDASNLA